MADTSDRTIPATPRRREQARQAGMGAAATLPAWAASAATAIMLVPVWARATIPAAAEAFREAVAAIGAPTGAGLPWPLPAAVVLPSLGLVAASAAAGLAVRLACDGLSFRPGRAALDFRRIDPLAGLARIFSPGTLAAVAGNAVALAVLVGAATLAIRPLAAIVATPPEPGDPAPGFQVAWRSLGWLVAAAAAVSVAQWLLARHRFERRIRMTPQEFADEAKDLQADPRVRLLQQQRRKNQPAATSGAA
jgi:flagellar biosynthetic protein FlhB